MSSQGGSSVSANVFTYGSLMFAEVWQPLVGGRYPAEPAVLPGYRRFAVPGVSYPGIVAASGQQVAGLLYRDVAPDDLARLDLFEGAEYRRDALQVTLADGSVAIAETYVWLDHGRLSDAVWLPEAFRLGEFLRTYAPASALRDG
jgi:gamma-glutamylcyclotransferase (GGCT)/AIG2-like uncharacterized protein YtfP